MSGKEVVVFGVDVSKSRLDISDRYGDVSLTVTNDETGIIRFIDSLERPQQSLIILESTGGLERQCAQMLVKSDVDVAIVNPRQARDFARGCGRLEKTDQIDAQCLAHMGEAVEVDYIEGFDSQRERLKGLVRFRTALVEQKTRLKNRLHRQRYDDLVEMLNEQIQSLEARIEAIEAKIDDCLEYNGELKEAAERLETVPGVGECVSRSLLANLPELGDLNRKEISKLAGVAPLNNDSGRRRGKRPTRGGRARVRSALYMAVLMAKQWCPPVKALHDRLENRNKPKKVILTACMRKLLTILNAMMRTQTSFQADKAMPKSAA